MDAWTKARSAAFKKYVHQEIGSELYDQAVQRLLPAFQSQMDPRQAFEAAVAEAERHFATGFTFPDLETWACEQEHDSDSIPEQNQHF